MDTASHVIFGIGLGALAQIDPVISNDGTLSLAVLIGTVAGSNAPDFDFMYRLKGKSCYYRNHRGLSHSLPAIPIWSLLISIILLIFFPGISFSHLFFWTLLAVILHIVFDLFNVNGTQVFRPFSSKWISLDFLPLVDPYIIMIHILGFSLLFYYAPGSVFSMIYLGIGFYILIRLISALLLKRKLTLHFPNALHIKLIPKTAPFQWSILIEMDLDYLFGSYSQGELAIEHTFSKKIDYPELVLYSSKDQQIDDFLRSTHYAYPFVHKRKSGYYIYWKDLRFRYKKFFPKQSIMFISLDNHRQVSYSGKFTSINHYKKVIKYLAASIK